MFFFLIWVISGDRVFFFGGGRWSLSAHQNTGAKEICEDNDSS